MAVLINKETGLAENLPSNLANQAAQSGSHFVPLNDENGEPINAGYDEASSLVSSGKAFHPNNEQLQYLLTHAKQQSLGETIKTGLEGAASVATLGGSRGIENLLFNNAKEQREREEFHPIAKAVGELGGLGATAFLPGLGEAGLAREALVGAENAYKAGEISIEGLNAAKTAAQHALNPISASSVLGKAGQLTQEATGLTGLPGQVARLAGEGVTFQAGDELGKMFEEDPGQTIGSAITNMGLAGALTPIVGVPLEGAGALWEATVGRKMAPYLKAVKDRLTVGGGVPQEEATKASSKLLSQYPELETVLGKEPTAVEAHNHLMNSDSSYGRKYREQLTDFKNTAIDEAINPLGFTQEDIKALPNKDEESAGKAFQGDVAKELESEYAPIKPLYEATEKKYSTVPLSEEDKGSLKNEILKLSEERGWGKNPDGEGFKESQKALKNLDLQENVNDLKNMVSNLSFEPLKPEVNQARGPLKRIFNEAKERIVTKTLGETEGPEALALHLEANQKYKSLMDKINAIDEKVNVPGWNGPETFLKNFKEMQMEKVFKKFTDPNDAAFTRLIQETYPQTAQRMQKELIEKELRSSRFGDGSLNLAALNKKLKAMPQQYKDFVFGEHAGNIESTADILNNISTSVRGGDNPSGTTRMADKIFGKIPTHMGALLLGATGHPGLAVATELLGYFVGKEAPDALRTAFLRAMAKGGAADSGSFKAIYDLANRAFKGAKAIDKAVKAAVGAGGTITLDALTPAKQAKIEKALEKFNQDPMVMVDAGGKLGEAEPGHASALGLTLSNALAVISEAKPKTEPQGMLDEKTTPSEVEKAHYERTLENVENPIRILKHIEDGTLTANDMQTFTRVFPDLHRAFVQKFTNELIDAKSKDVDIPYHVKMGLSLFMGTPLDSTLTPQFIASNQVKPPQAPQGQAQPKGQGRGSKKALDKWASMEMTPQQQRIQGKNT